MPPAASALLEPIYLDLLIGGSMTVPDQPDQNAAAAVPAPAEAPASSPDPAADESESVRTELNTMFDSYRDLQGIKARLDRLDTAGKARVAAWLKDHINL
jgi:hypothetical protein